MEVLDRPQIGSPLQPDSRPGLGEARSRELARFELRAAIGVVARQPAFRVVVSSMAIDVSLVAELDEIATSAGVVLERKIRPGGGLDVVVRSA
jgi:hypothetical protein